MRRAHDGVPFQKGGCSGVLVALALVAAFALLGLVFFHLPPFIRRTATKRTLLVPLASESIRARLEKAKGLRGTTYPPSSRDCVEVPPDPATTLGASPGGITYRCHFAARSPRSLRRAARKGGVAGAGLDRAPPGVVYRPPHLKERGRHVRASNPKNGGPSILCWRALHGSANLAYLSRFLFPGLSCGAPYCVPGGVRSGVKPPTMVLPLYL
jgi:hypothetical protein